MAAADQAAAVLTARRTFAALLVAWPPQVSHPLGEGAGSDLAADGIHGSGDDEAVSAAETRVVTRETFLRILKLTAAAEDAVAGSGKIATGTGLGIGDGGVRTLPRGVPAMSALQLLLRRCLAAETSRSGETGAAAAGSGMRTAYDDSAYFSESLVAEVSQNILSATKVGGATTSERKMRESLHPHVPQCDAQDTITCPGARALWVIFDPRCSLADGCRLRFYSGAKSSNRVAGSFSGEGDKWRPFVVHGDSVAVAFSAQAQQRCGWGYRFWVAPMHGLQWENETEAPEGGSLEWALFVLELLLRDAGSLVE